MNLAAHLLNVVEVVDRRILGGIQFLDAVTRLPIKRTVTLQARWAELVRQSGNVEVALPEKSIRFRQNRSGMHVILAAPFFAQYTASFLEPQIPPETQPGPLRLHIAVVDAGPHYLPREIVIDLPRPADPNTEHRVFDPLSFELFRSPVTPVQSGWALLRLRITQAGSTTPLPGVLVRVFPSPRSGAGDAIGAGMTEWRGRTRGEALVSLTTIKRFRPGSGENVFESEQPVELEVARELAFTGAPEQFADPDRIRAAIPQDPAVPSPQGFAVQRISQPVNVSAGGEISLELSTP